MRALITGAASGIGRAIALELARRGDSSGHRVRLLLADVTAAPLDGVCRDAMALGAEAHAMTADLAEDDGPARVVDAALDALDGLDALVSNAGIISNGALADLPLAEWERGFAVNTRATWLLARRAHDALAASRGAILATASISATQPTAPHGPYSASKAALTMLVQQLAYEWGPEGIRANTISPGAVHTPMTDRVYSDPEALRRRAAQIPLRRVAGPEDIARAAAFLLSPDADYITGVDLLVDGGLHTVLMPTLRGLGGV